MSRTDKDSWVRKTDAEFRPRPGRHEKRRERINTRRAAQQVCREFNVRHQVDNTALV